MIHIECARLSVIEMPLKKPFSTHLGTVYKRQSIIIELIDQDGVSGFGEVVAFSSPWYTEETVKTALHMIKDFLLPTLFKHLVTHPQEITKLYDSIRKNEMAKAGIETAIWDLYAKKHKKPLSKLLGGNRDSVLAGGVVAAQNVQEALKQIEKLNDQGYQRIKLKINPKNDIEFLKEIRKKFPEVPLMVDANSAYTLKDLQQLQALDQFNLLMIEQPLAVSDLVEHSILQKQIKTPICLDESITSLHDAYSAIMLGSCQIINIKVGRVGGLENARRIQELCLQHDLRLWCGGMIEFGISRAHNIAIASLEGFTLPGDLSSSNHYWEEDIIEPFIEVHNGKIKVPKEYGIGFEINQKRLQEVTIDFSEYVKGKSS